MTITDRPTMPEPLEDFLNTGGNPADRGCDVWERFQDELIAIADTTLEGAGPLHSSDLRFMAQSVVDGIDRSPFGPRFQEHDGDEGWASKQEYVTCLAWTADLVEDPRLAERLKVFLTAEQLDRLAQQTDLSRRPHPLNVESPDQPWRCSACGDQHQPAEVALNVGHHEGWNDGPRDDDVGPWCFSCVTMAYEAMKTAQG